MTTFIDRRQGRLFGKIGLVDILILLLLVALVLFAVVRFAKPADALVTVETTLTVEKVRDPTVITIAEVLGVRRRRGASGRARGTQATRMPLDVFTADGRPVTGAISQVYWDLEIKVRGEGHDSGSDISVGGVVLRRSRYYAAHGSWSWVRRQDSDQGVRGG